MNLKVRCLDLDAGGKAIVILNKSDAEELGVHALDRVILSWRKRKLTTIVNISELFVKLGEVAIYNEVKEGLCVNNGDVVVAKPREELLSKRSIRRKINGLRLDEREIKEIVNDVLERDLNDLEIAAFVTALHIRGMSTDEIVSLSKAMVESGEKLKLNKKIILDKHSLGGVPGDKTTLLLVPIIASSGLTIPKTSSRAITSPTGTADRVECLCPVNLDIKEMVNVIKKTNGCMVWGGSINIAPVDDLFIQIEYPLGLDPLYISSIMSKKKAVGATHLVVDLPTGRGTKVKTFGSAHEFAKDFIEIGKRLNINTACAITFGEQPIGNAIGPALEAREALETIHNLKSTDLVDKACSLAGILLEMVGKGNKQIALQILKSGKAEKKLRHIIEEQGGNPKIKLGDIPIGDKCVTINASKSGTVMWIKNAEIADIAKLAGAPKDKEAGILLHAKIGSVVKENQPLFTIYAKKSGKLNEAEMFAKQTEPVVIIKDINKGMLIKTIKEYDHERLFFALER